MGGPPVLVKTVDRGPATRYPFDMVTSPPYLRRSGTGRISERLYSIGSPMVSFYVYTDGRDGICIDSGASAAAALAGMRRIGVDPLSISYVFLTHSDHDHTGGIQAFPRAIVVLPRAEEPVASGELPRRILFIRRRNRFGSPHESWDDGQIVDVGGIRVRGIATPGHTVGSMSYLVNDEALFTGDLLYLSKGAARPGPRIFTEDVAESARSMARLASLVPSVSILCTAHSGFTRSYGAAMESWKAGRSG